MAEVSLLFDIWQGKRKWGNLKPETLKLHTYTYTQLTKVFIAYIGKEEQSSFPLSTMEHGTRLFKPRQPWLLFNIH